MKHSKLNFKNAHNLSKRTNQLTLENLISQSVYINNKGWVKTNNLLTEEITDQITDLIGGRKETKRIISIVLKNQKFSKWYLSRIMYSPTRKTWSYCAGQDYISEIREIRKDLINRY